MDYSGDSTLNTLNQAAIQIQQCRKNLQLSVSEVKTSIHSSFSRLLEMVRSREVFLLNQVDIIQRLSEDAIRAQETSINRAVNSATDQLILSNASSMTSSLLAESNSLDHVLSLQASVSSISFEADISTIRQAICKFGKVNSAPFHPSLDSLHPVPMTASFVDNSFKGVLDFSATAPTMQGSFTQDQHEREIDHDDFVVIAEDDNISIVAGSGEDVTELTVNTMMMTDLTISDRQTSDVSALRHHDNNDERLVTTEDGSNGDGDERSRLIGSQTLLSTGSSNCDDAAPATEPEQSGRGGSTPDNDSTEIKPFNSELLARMSALPVEHWLIR